MVSYNWSKGKRDLLAGLTVAAISLPQGMAYALIAGVDPLFGVSEKAVEAALATLIGSGNVPTCINARRDVGYCLAGATPVSASRLPSPTRPQPATPPLTRRVDGALVGYDRQLDAHRSLAMLVRR